MTDLHLQTSRLQADRLARSGLRIELHIRRTGWLQPMIGAEFQCNGATWIIDRDPVEKGDAWLIEAAATYRDDASAPDIVPTNYPLVVQFID